MISAFFPQCCYVNLIKGIVHYSRHGTGYKDRKIQRHSLTLE